MPDAPIQLTEAQVIHHPHLYRLLSFLGSTILTLSFVLLLFEGTTYEVLKTACPILYAISWPWPYVLMAFQQLLATTIWLLIFLFHKD